MSLSILIFFLDKNETFVVFFLCWKFGRKLIIDLSVASSRFPPDPSMNPGNIGDLKNFSETVVWRWVSYHFKKVS